MKNRRFQIFSIIIILLLIIVTGGFVFTYFLTSPKRQIVGNFTRNIDLSSDVSDSVHEWLSTAAMGDKIDTDEYINDIFVTISITFTSDGNYNIAVDESSYEDARIDVYTAFSKAFKELILARISASGVGELTEDEIENKMIETIGMSVQEYLLEYAPEILPPLSELKALYDEEGTYYVEKNILTLNENSSSYFIVNEELLAITDTDLNGETYVYFRSK